MTEDPFLQLVCDALGLMNKAVMFPPSDQWPLAGPDCSQLFAKEFYHQFRKLWDRAIPVGVGLGHLVFRQEAVVDLAIFRRPENGGPDLPFAVLRFTTTAWKSDERLITSEVVSADFRSVDTIRTLGVYKYAVVVTLGPRPVIEPLPNVAHINFDLDRWTATVLGT